MIKELFYEFTLMNMKIFLGSNPKGRGWYDNKRLYEKKSFLNWKVHDLNKERKE